MAKVNNSKNPEGLLVDPVQSAEWLKLTLAAWKADSEISKGLLDNFKLFIKHATPFEKARFFSEDNYHLPPASSYKDFKAPTLFVRVCCKVVIIIIDLDGIPTRTSRTICTSYPLQTYNPLLHKGKNCTVNKF
jgi:hypothetical protein